MNIFRESEFCRTTLAAERGPARKINQRRSVLLGYSIPPVRRTGAPNIYTMSNIEAPGRSRRRPHDVGIGGNVFKEFDPSSRPPSKLVVRSTAGKDTLNGALGFKNFISGLAGDGLLVGREMNDTLNGGDDNDRRYGRGRRFVGAYGFG